MFQGLENAHHDPTQGTEVIYPNEKSKYGVFFHVPGVAEHYVLCHPNHEDL